jgi:hypothetical protein
MNDHHENHHECVDLDRLRRVLRKFGADRQPIGSEARDAYQQIIRSLEFGLGEKILWKSKETPGTWHEGVVISYMVHAPKLVVGPGDDRKAKFGDTPLFGVCGHDLRVRKGNAQLPRSPWPNAKQNKDIP